MTSRLFPFFLFFSALLLASPVHYRQDERRSGSFEGSLPLPLVKSWQKTFPGASFAAAPVKCQDKLILGSRDKKLYILHAFTGELFSTFEAQGWIDMPVSCEGNFVYFGDRAGNCYALNFESGKLLFQFSAGSELLSSPLISGEAVYFTTGALFPALYALDKKTGALFFKLPFLQPSFSSPVLASSGIFVATNGGKYYLVNQGSFSASFESKGETLFFTPFAEKNETYAFAGDYGAKLFKLSLPSLAPVIENAFLAPDRVVKPSGLTDGKDRLFLSLGELPQGSPAKRQKLYAFDKSTLQLLWVKELGLFSEWTKVPGSLYGDGKVLTTTFDGRFLVLDSATGNFLFEESLDPSGIMAEPFFQNGQIFVATLNGTVAGYEVGSSEIPPSVSLTFPQNDQKVNKSFSVLGSVIEEHLKFYQLELYSGSNLLFSFRGYEPKKNESLAELDTRAYPDGSYRLLLSAEDIKGQRASTEARFVIDNTPPSLALTSPQDNFLTNKRELLVSGTTDGQAVKVNGVSVPLQNGAFSYTLSLSEGENTLSVLASDELNNEVTVRRRVVLDLTPPSLVLVSPTEGEVTNLTPFPLKGKVETGAKLSVNGQSIAYDKEGIFSFSLELQKGENSLVVTAEDEALNRTAVTRKVFYDPEALPLKVMEPEEGAVTNRAEILLSGKTEAQATLTVNGASVSVNSDGTFSAPVSLQEGENKILVKARLPGKATLQILENVREEEIKLSEVVRTVFRDTVPPFLSLEAPQDGLLTNQKEIPVKGKAEAGSTVTLNGKALLLASDGSFSTSFSLQEGENSLLLESKDRAGNGSKISRKVTLDTVPPQLALIQPPDRLLTRVREQVVQGSVEAEASVFVNGQEAFVQEGSFSFPFLLQEGENFILVKAKDKAGNESSKTLTLYLDTSPPEGSLSIKKTPFGIVSSREVEVLITGKDQGYGLQGFLLSEKENFSGASLQPFSGGSLTVKFTFSQEGSQKLYFKLVDRAGNESPVYSDTLFIDGAHFFMEPLDLATGGSFKTKDGTVLVLPQGALKLLQKFSGTPYLVMLDPGLIDKNRVPEPEPEDFAATSVVREIFVSDSAGNRLAVEIEKPLSLTLPYQSQELREGAILKNLRITAWRAGNYEILEGEQKHDEAKKTVTASFTSFGLFRLLEVRVDSHQFISSFFSYPNPFSFKQGSTITYRLREDAQEVTLELYSSAGGKISSWHILPFQKGSLIGRNEVKFKSVASGFHLPNGVYFLRIVSTDSQNNRQEAFFKAVVLE